MKILIKQNFKSLVANKEVELPNFCILTGKNGSGKSHFLEALEKNGIANILDEEEKMINFSDVRYIRFNQLNPQIESTCDRQHLNQNLNQYIQAFRQILPNLKQPNVENNSRVWENGAISFGINSSVLKNLVFRVARRAEKEIRDVTEDDIRWFRDDFDIDPNDAFSGQFAKIIHSIFQKISKIYLNPYAKCGKFAETTTPQRPPKHKSLKFFLFRQ